MLFRIIHILLLLLLLSLPPQPKTTPVVRSFDRSQTKSRWSDYERERRRRLLRIGNRQESAAENPPRSVVGRTQESSVTLESAASGQSYNSSSGIELGSIPFRVPLMHLPAAAAVSSVVTCLSPFLARIRNSHAQSES